MSYFQTNCTLPSPGVHYVYSPNTRGTLQILWSCLSTLLLCTWSIKFVLEVVPDLQRHRRRRQAIRDTVAEATSHLITLLSVILGPELIFALAVDEFVDARRTIKANPSTVCDEDPFITMTHVFFGSAKGYRLRYDLRADDEIVNGLRRQKLPSFSASEESSRHELKYLGENQSTVASSSVMNRAARLVLRRLSLLRKTQKVMSLGR